MQVSVVHLFNGSFTLTETDTDTDKNGYSQGFDTTGQSDLASPKLTPKIKISLVQRKVRSSRFNISTVRFNNN